MDGKQYGIPDLLIHLLSRLLDTPSFAVAIAVILLSACSEPAQPPGPPLKEAEIVGQYRIEESTGLDELTLRPDGTYAETVTYNKAKTSGFIAGNVYHYSGKWAYSVVNGEAQVKLADAVVDISIHEPPDRFDFTFRAYREQGIVVLDIPDTHDPDGTLVYHKVSDKW